jgi:hypothetical protein
LKSEDTDLHELATRAVIRQTLSEVGGGAPRRHPSEDSSTPIFMG